MSMFTRCTKIIPSSCEDIKISCYSVRTFEYGNTKISSSPINISFDNIAFYINNETFPLLCCKLFNFSHELEMFDFDTCKIEKIEKCFSERVHNVTGNIKITNNRITVIEKHIFRNLKVRPIILSKNFIVCI